MGLRGRIALAGFLLVAAAACADPISQLHPSNYVNDFAHVLSAQTEADLNDTCLQIDQKAHAQIAVVTINSLDGSDIESYAVELFQKWGIGNKATNRGALILVAVNDHKYRFEVGYGLEPILPDGKVGGFGREAVPLLRQNDYNGAVRLMTLRVADVIARDAGVQLTGAQAPPEPPPGTAPGMSVAGILFLIFIVIIVLATPLRGLLWLLLWGGGPRWSGGSRSGYWGGGGFGGGGWSGGGGGGFGGFGGGMSGGGGASGGW